MFVAQLKEVVGLVDAAAPHPQQVDVGVGRVRDPSRVPSTVHSGRKGVVGYPVRPPYEHRGVVDPQLEPCTARVVGRVDLDRTESDPHRTGIVRRAHDEFMPCLRTESPGPPQFRVVDRELDHGPVATDRGGRAASDLARHLDALVRIAFQVHRDAHRAVRPGRRTDRVDARPTPAFDRDRPPNAGGDHVRSPVPAEVAGGLAHHGVWVRVGLGPAAESVHRRRGDLERRVELNHQRVRANHEDVAHIEAIAPVLVGDLAYQRAVERDRGRGVKTVAGEVVPGLVMARPVEPQFVAPAAASDPGQRLLVRAQVRVGDRPGSKQIGVDDPGHHRGIDPADDVRGDRSAGCGDAPSTVELATDHRASTCARARTARSSSSGPPPS